MGSRYLWIDQADNNIKRQAQNLVPSSRSSSRLKVLMRASRLAMMARRLSFSCLSASISSCGVKSRLWFNRFSTCRLVSGQQSLNPSLYPVRSYLKGALQSLHPTVRASMSSISIIVFESRSIGVNQTFIVFYNDALLAELRRVSPRLCLCDPSNMR